MTCVCAEEKYSQWRKEDGHVRTADLRILPMPSLARKLGRGRSYRMPPPSANTFAPTYLRAIQQAMKDYIHRISDSRALPEEAFAPWKTEVLRAVKTNLTSGGIQVDQPEDDTNDHDQLKDGCYWSDLERKELEKFSKSFVLGPVDKGASSWAIVCKAGYIGEMVNCQLTEPRYESISQDQAQALFQAEKTFIESKNYLKAFEKNLTNRAGKRAWNLASQPNPFDIRPRRGVNATNQVRRSDSESHQ